MTELYEALPDPVSKDDFIAILERNEHEAEGFKERDPTAWNIIEFHRKNHKQTYKLINLTEEGFNRLVVPYHIHDNFYFAPPEGGNFWQVSEIYLNAMNNPSMKGHVCVDKVRRLTELKTWETTLTFISNDPDFAVTGHYRKRMGEFFYGGGYHRLIACGVWMKKNNLYPPLTIYYCEVSS